MRIYLLRHGKSLAGYPDADRELAGEGYAQLEALGGFLRGQKRFQPALVWCSPLLRAQQTAAVFQAALGRAVVDVCTLDALEPERDPAALVEPLTSLTEDVLVVGHNPNLELLASLLCSGERSRSRVRMKTSSLLCLEFHPRMSFGEQGPCELEWLLDSRLLF